MHQSTVRTRRNCLYKYVIHNFIQFYTDFEDSMTFFSSPGKNFTCLLSPWEDGRKYPKMLNIKAFHNLLHLSIIEMKPRITNKLDSISRKKVWILHIFHLCSDYSLLTNHWSWKYPKLNKVALFYWRYSYWKDLVGIRKFLENIVVTNHQISMILSR